MRIFFFYSTATTVIYTYCHTLSLHDALPISIAGLFLIYFLSFFIRGMVGFGSVTLAVLFSAWILPPHYAVVLAMAASVYAQVQLLPQGLAKGDWRIAWPVIAGGVVAIAVGVWIFAHLQADRKSVA